MSRLPLRQWRRCRLLFALALCAWLGLAGSVFARADCCTVTGGMAAAMTATHHGGAPAPLHADGTHADCVCAHATATLPELSAPIVSVRPVATMWRAWPAVAPKLPHAPPLRPPLA